VEQAGSVAEIYSVNVFACPQVVMELLKVDGKAWLTSMEIPSQKAHEFTLGMTSVQQKAEKSTPALMLSTVAVQAASDDLAARASFSPQVASVLPGSKAALLLPIAEDPPGHKEHFAAAPSRSKAQTRR